MHAYSAWKGAASVAYQLKNNPESTRTWKLRWKPVCASTETELSKWLLEKPISYCEYRAIISSSQRFGKGQYGRTWSSPKGGVWISVAMSVEKPFFRCPELLGLAIALSLAERLENKGVKVKIKWPNDLLVNGYKLAGVLPKLIYRGNNLRLVRVGIGLNISNSVPKGAVSLVKIIGNKSSSIDKWSSEVLIAIGKTINSDRLVDKLIDDVNKRLWASEIIDPKSGHLLKIKGVNEFGELVLSGIKEEIVWTRRI